jgi:hypothetical protein
MKQVIHILVLCLSSLLFTGAEVRAENASPCAEDITKLCNGVQHGGGRIMNCLKEHEQELSAACKEHQAKMVKMLKNVPQACQDDVEQFCRQIRPVGRRIIRCLKQNETILSTECGNRMKEVK